MRLWMMAGVLALAGCAGDETVRAYGAADRDWHLQSIDGVAFSAKAVLRFPQEGQLSGEAPCNTFSARQDAPYPWFEARQIVTTKRACSDLDLESRFLAALREMTLSEVSGDILVLSTPAGREMVFAAR
jgi:heat shock protein HslJ